MINKNCAFVRVIYIMTANYKATYHIMEFYVTTCMFTTIIVASISPLYIYSCMHKCIYYGGVLASIVF